MIILYIKTGCPFCAAVLQKINSLGLKYTEKNILDENNLQELISLKGSGKVPFMVDEGKKISMGESQDIINYLEKYYRNGEHLDISNIG